MELAFVIYLIDNITALKGSFWGFGDMVGMSLVFSIVTAFALVVIFISTDQDLVYGDSAKAERLANREKYQICYSWFLLWFLLCLSKVILIFNKETNNVCIY